MGNVAPVLTALHGGSTGLTRPTGIRPHCQTDPAPADLHHSQQTWNESRDQSVSVRLSPSLPACSLRGVWQ